MEKRVILAFVLSIVVLIGWSFLFGTKTQQTSTQSTNAPEEGEAAHTTSTPPPTVTPSTTLSDVTVTPSAPSAPSSDVEEKEIVIQTPLYRAVFTNVGPTIKSFELKDYKETVDPDSPLIELVTFKEESANFLLINFDSPSVEYDPNRVFETDQESLNMGPDSPPQDLVFESTLSKGMTISQTFRFYPNQYKIDAYFASSGPLTGRFKAEIAAMPPKKKKGYYSKVGLALLANNEMENLELKPIEGKFRGKTEEEAIQKACEEFNTDRTGIDILESESYGDSVKIIVKGPQSATRKPESHPERDEKGRIDWVAYEDGYFISAVIPHDPFEGEFEGVCSKSGLLQGILTGPPVTIGSDPNEPLVPTYTLYFGPRDLKTLKKIGYGLDRAIDFGWFWFDPIAKFLLYLLLAINKYVHNYGVAIILLTILVKILFWPLTHKSQKSMKEMQKLQPHMAKIREKYKDDKQKMNQELMGLYKTYKVNPMGGCMPMLIQLPVFFALFRVLGSSIELRHAPFMLWITDLSAPDRLFDFSFRIPFMQAPYGIPVLTLLMGASMFIQQKMTPTVGDPAQAKMMMFLPVIFTFMFINFPSGLVLYWFVSNILTIAQQYGMKRRGS